MSRSNSKAAAVVVRGPFGPFATAYGAELRELGYTPLGVVKQLRQLARLSRWLEQAGMGAADLSDDALERFVAAGLGLGTASTPGLAALLVVVRRAGIAAEAAQVSDAVDDGLLVSFRRHLLAERGIGESTADRYVDYARRFLAGQSGAGELSVLTSAEITRCVQHEAARVAVASTQYFVAGLRAFLRFCFIAASGALGKQRQFSLPPLPAGEGQGSQRDQPDQESHSPGDRTLRPRQRVALDDSYNEVRRDEARKDERHLPPLHHGNLLPKKACSGTIA